MGWYSEADKSVKGKDAGDYTGGPPKGVLHTTEGSSAKGAINAFKFNNTWPHFLVDYQGKVWQFIDSSKAARALRNLKGGVETGRDHAVQVEVVGFAGKPNDHPSIQFDALRRLMRWIEKTEGVKSVGPPLPFASRYGQPGTRLPNNWWDEFNGWCGHSHVPENDHWDPGMIDLISLLSPKELIKPMYDPPLHMGNVVAFLSRPGGVIVLNDEGAIYAFGCRDAGAPNRHPEYWKPEYKAVGLAPLGETGYFVAKEGANTDPVFGSPGWYAYP